MIKTGPLHACDFNRLEASAGLSADTFSNSPATFLFHAPLVKMSHGSSLRAPQSGLCTSASRESKTFHTFFFFDSFAPHPLKNQSIPLTNVNQVQIVTVRREITVKCSFSFADTDDFEVRP